MIYENLSYQKKDHVVIITIAEQTGHHWQIPQLANELSYLCSTIATEKKVRVVTIHWKQREPSPGSGAGKGDMKYCSLSAAVAALNIPVIAVVDGYATGRALELVLACDIRIVSENSYFGLPHLSFGIIPSDGGTQRMSRLVGKSKAIELILTGEIINASEALKIGLVNRISRDQDPLTEAMEMAHKIASKSPIATKYAKEAVSKGMDLTLEQGMRLEADLYYLIHTTKDRHEGIKAFQEKRQAFFKGN